MRRRQAEATKETQEDLVEVRTIEVGVLKMSALLQLGFGEAGAAPRPQRAPPTSRG